LKRIAPIGLMLLLLYHMFGLSFAVLYFEKDYQVAAVSGPRGDQKMIKMYHPSLPYSGDVEISGEIKGLIRTENEFYNPVQVLHSNDTLYITLESNQGARDRFVELAGAMEMLSDTKAEQPQSPYSKAIKLFSNLLNSYVPAATHNFEVACRPVFTIPAKYQTLNPDIYLSCTSQLNTPPPEHC
jgi:hypothetical protein